MTSRTLLGFLSRFASFTTQSEVLCTQGLAYLLRQYHEARSAMADEVRTRTDIEIGDSITWLAEALQEDMARPDLEARTDDGVPLVKIEAKLGADLLPEQLRSYRDDLLKRNSGDSVLLVLVPKTRTVGVTATVLDAFDLSGPEPWAVCGEDVSGKVIVSVISWDELFTVFDQVSDKRFKLELEQLREMYQELRSNFIAPLASGDDLKQWESSDTDFVKLVDQVTRQLTTNHRIYPMRLESLEYDSPEPGNYHLRYVCPGIGGAKSCYSIGVRDSFEEWLTPIWMRFHRDTAGFQSVLQRIENSNVRALNSGGHIWIPLDVPAEVSAEAMIQSLVEQTEEVLRVAFAASDR